MNDFLYMVGIVAVGFAINFGLRAVPFLIFGSRKTALPSWVAKFGDYVSPVIIACLIVYSYSGLEWKTVWPYLAGLVTVVLQVWKRNPLASIVVGTVLYMCLLNCGCVTRPVYVDSLNPSVRVAHDGIWLAERHVEPVEVPEMLEDNDIPKSRTIHILLDSDVKDMREARFLMACLAKHGYTRPVLVTKRHGESYLTGKKPTKVVSGGLGKAQSKQGKKIRYKKSDE